MGQIYIHVAECSVRITISTYYSTGLLSARPLLDTNNTRMSPGRFAIGFTVAPLSIRASNIKSRSLRMLFTRSTNTMPKVD